MKTTFLSRFTPSLMKHDDLEAIFVQRENLAKQLVEDIHDSALTPSKHYVLLIGPRGVGKTHLIALIYHRIRALDDLRGRLLIAWLREEEWGVTSFLDLLMRVLRALQEGYGDKDLSEHIKSLPNLPARTAEVKARKILSDFVGERVLLILMENLEDLFKGLDDDGQKKFRSYLQENPFSTILATSQSLFNGVSLRDSPFYGFFHIHHLGDLELDDAVLLLAKIANLRGDQGLASFIKTPTGRARIRAVHHLAGGNHRIYVVFSQFLSRESLDELVDSVMQMLDDMTPYYQARMIYLSPQQRKIVDFLCERRGAVPVKEIARQCFMTHQTASSQLKSMSDAGYVRSDAVGRESYYELREPLMRLCAEVKKQRGGPIRLLVDFLRLWFSPKELRQKLELLSPEAITEQEYLQHALKITEEETENPVIAACLRDLEACKNDPVSALKVLDELVAVRGSSADWTSHGFCLIRLKHPDGALASFDKAIKIEPNDADACFGRGAALGKLRRYDEALVSFDKVTEIKPNDVLSWILRGVMLSALGCNDEALASADKAIELEPDNALAWNFRGKALGLLGRYDEALASFNRAIELGGQFSFFFFYRAEAMLALNRWDEGLAELDIALSRFAHADEPDTGDTKAILHNLFASTNDAGTWRTRVRSLVDVYKKHDVPSDLGQGLTRGISDLKSPMISQAAAQAWLNVWQEAGGDYPELQIPLRLLDAAVRYRESQDPRILLALPVEERKILKSLLGIEDTSE